MTKDEIIKIGRNVIKTEIVGLEKLKDGLGDEFACVIDLIYSLKGRVITIGIGKSAHVARKIAATLSSTGTPACFVHAAEASHGDLGMITEQDAVVALSNSGETQEFRDLIQYCIRFSIPLVTITAKPSSMLGVASTICLAIPKAPEACKEISAPTTSTTIMMALGDSLAIALLERRGFKALNFKLLHPGGSIGIALTRVCDVMHTGSELPLVLQETLMLEVIVKITSTGFGCAGVIDENGLLVGVITDGDLRRHMGAALITSQAKAVMSKSPLSIFGDMLLSDALQIMTARGKKITSIFVIKNNYPIGMVHIHDCLRARIA